MNLWNIKNLQLPPRNTYRARCRDVDIITLRKVVGEAINTFKNDAALKQEAALLSRCIYRMKMKFRSDKGLKGMEKMNRALLQYLRMDMPHTLETFYGMIPHKYESATYLPTLNMLHYILVRTQGLAKLMVRIVECSRTAALFMEGRISIGHLWKVAFICFTVISKIFALTKQWTKFCCKFYSQLIPFTKTLKNVGVKWLPMDYKFPDDLKSWLYIDWLDKDEILLPKPKKLRIPTIFDIIDSDSEVEFCGEYTEINDGIEVVNEYVDVDKDINENKLKMENQMKKEETNSLKNEIKLMTLNTDEDIGEIIAPLNQNVRNKQKKRKRQSSLQLNNEEIKMEKLYSNGNQQKTSNKFSKNQNKLKKKRPNSVEDNNTSLVIVQDKQEDVGEVMDSLNKSTNRKKSKHKKVKLVKSINLLEEIKTLKDLKQFEKNFDRIQQEHPSVFNTTDKLQRNMLHRSIKSYIGKAMKNSNNHAKVESYIIKAKNVLKSTLL